MCYCLCGLCNCCDEDNGFHKDTQIKCSKGFYGNFNKKKLDEETCESHYIATNGNITKSPIEDILGNCAPAFYFQNEYNDTQRSLPRQSAHRQQQFKRSRSADQCNNLYSNDIHLSLLKEIKGSLPDASKLLPAYKENRFKTNRYPYKCTYCARTFKKESDVNNHIRDTNYGDCRVRAYADTKIDSHFKEIVSSLSKKACLQTDEYGQVKAIVSDVLSCILKSSENNNRFSKFVNREGSTRVGLKTGKPTEFDYSVSLALCETPKIDWQAPLS